MELLRLISSHENLRLFPLQGRKIGLDLVVLCNFALNIVVDADEFLAPRISCSQLAG